METIWQGIVLVVQNVFGHLMIINLFLSVVIVFFRRKDPKSVWAWLLILYFIPVLGFIIYLLIGTDMFKRKRFQNKEIEDKLSEAIRRQERIVRGQELMTAYPEMESYRDLVLYHLHTSQALLTDDNQVQFFVDGKKKFEALIADMRKARHSIHIQYYIIRDDEAFAAIREVLLKKVAAGVEVRILYDAMGCRGTRKKFWKKLAEEGIENAAFFPAFFGNLQLRANYRNHRKIVVIDGEIAYMGGFNVAREYLGKDKRFGYWRDTHMRITGSAVEALQWRFVLDWNFTAKNKISSYDKYLKEIKAPILSGCPMQIVSSGPDMRQQTIRDTYLYLIHKAQKSIYIQSPYFIPDEAIMAALLMAVRSGIEVSIMIPCKPDHPFVYWASYSYVGELALEGARCYAYTNGFLHAKGMIVDEMVLCYGTANMDIRSFALNFEVNAVVYDKEKAREMTEYFREDLRFCRPITRDIYLSRKLLVRVKEQCSRLLSPLL